ncbi:layilin isoform X2 [Apus apus]|uniref:layilin isoform X2 n=1 Tax=Apus apus TaxID=8895 RepID=UPI0021F91126|nr:layilin isoform X2 [Apus apus]
MLAAAALCAAALGWAAGTRLRSGQTVCRGGTQQPCYKVVYFHDASRRISYEEAHLACKADGGHLVSIGTEAEQRLIEKFIESLLASDGDFWIGLRRKKEEVDNSTECQNLYSWSDGSSSEFRNWYADEPSCGSEICVVMYHQPSAPPGVGGPYMFQWNDDRCNMKNNFICKYSLEKPTKAPIENSQRDAVTEPLIPVFPGERQKKDANLTVVEAKEDQTLLDLLPLRGTGSYWIMNQTRSPLRTCSESCLHPHSQHSSAAPPDGPCSHPLFLAFCEEETGANRCKPKGGGCLAVSPQEEQPKPGHLQSDQEAIRSRSGWNQA